MSPSSRRAGIEIVLMLTELCPANVALLAEGGDRNWYGSSITGPENRSPSSRRAGIEIILADEAIRRGYVALLAEGGDRNKATL